MIWLISINKRTPYHRRESRIGKLIERSSNIRNSDHQYEERRCNSQLSLDAIYQPSSIHDMDCEKGNALTEIQNQWGSETSEDWSLPIPREYIPSNFAIELNMLKKNIMLKRFYI